MSLDDLRRAALPLTGDDRELDALIERIGDKSLVLVGEASHGTHEFYEARARLTQRLIAERGFNAVAVEADWPDAYRVNRFARGLGRDAQAAESLGSFERFPRWMWRNAEVLRFVGWLHQRNRPLPEAQRAGFYGLDLYSLHSSMEAVIQHLERVDPAAAARARARYACFGDVSREAQQYGYDVFAGAREDCQEEAIRQVLELRQRAWKALERDGLVAAEERFHAEQNARLVANAEEYYREMFGGRVNTWNLRDTHMADTLGALRQHLARGGQDAKIVVWAHNSHVGDGRATDFAARGELNLGQLARERWAGQAYLVGFTTFEGTVSAASEWGAPLERKRVRPGLAGSVEVLLHAVGDEIGGDFLLLTDEPAVASALRKPLLERAIGVIYKPETERWSHYFRCKVAEQFDAVLHYDATRALVPLDRTSQWERGEGGEDLPETYPYGL